ncbi:MAG TPA: hypothetical protein VHR16_01420 [Candidatus Limnocylindrales bacterium]|nr:hypothetical protein [Candidatus Limnocylindrales bacterium]
MTASQNLESLLRAHYEARADRSVPDGQLGAVLAKTVRRRQRPAWLAALRSPTMTATTLTRPAIPRATWVIAAAALLLALAVAAALIAGSFVPARPRTNGQIVFATMNDSLGDTVAFVANPDGTHVRKLVDFTVEGPFWSPDGSRIGLGHGVVNADGTGLRMWDESGLPFHIECWDWSPDGQRMLCEGFVDGDAARDAEIHGVYSVRAEDGSDPRRLTAPGQMGIPAAYSPDGASFLWGLDSDGTESCLLMVSDADGSNPRQLSTAHFGCDPTWAPDGKSVLAQNNGTLYSVDLATGHLTPIVLKGVPGAVIFRGQFSPDGARILVKRSLGDGNNELYSMLPDGSDLVRITNSAEDDRFFDWGVHPLVP